MTRSTKSKKEEEQDFLSDDEYWEESANEAVRKLDKEIGWPNPDNDGDIGNGNDNNNENGKSQKISTKVLRLLEPKIGLLFRDDTDTAFASISVNAHTEISKIDKCKNFNLWVRKEYYDYNNGASLSGDILREVIDTLHANALFSGNVKNLELRVNKDPDNELVYWYDLTNEKREAIRITQGGWSIVASKEVPIIFRRRSGQLPQVHPSKDYPEDIFDQFINLINIKDDNQDIKLLLKCYIISLVIPGIAKAMLMVHGPEGAAKTALEDLIKMLIDPGILTNLTVPGSRKELIQQLQHNYLTYYDNLRIIPSWLSDDLCRAVTGTASSKRELYSDDDDVFYQYMRPVGFNGIPLVANRSDLLDRGLIIELERIDPKKRLSFEDDIKPRLERIKPQLLGFIFDIVVKVLQVKAEGGINLKSVSRMADFEIVCETISRCLGYSDGKFTQAYKENKNIGISEIIEGSPVARAIIKLMESNYRWSGTATELLVILEEVASLLKINTVKEKSWPKGANILSIKLKEVKSNLEEVGIYMSTEQNTKTKTKTIILEKRAYPVIIEETSPEQPDNQINTDLSTKSLAISGDMSGDTNIQNHPTDNPKIEHDFDHSDGSGGSGDSFSVIRGEGSNDISDSNRFDIDALLDATKRVKITNTLQYPPKCYYCESNGFKTEDEYERHGIKHGKPLYPSFADIKALGLPPQGMPWEQEPKIDVTFEEPSKK